MLLLLLLLTKSTLSKYEVSVVRASGEVNTMSDGAVVGEGLYVRIAPNASVECVCANPNQS
jgi:hypothetical protein